jgi:hypothetical protein
MGLSYGFILWVYPMHFINRFISWVLQRKLSNGLFVRTKLYNLCCPASPCPPCITMSPSPRDPNPGNPTVPLIRTFNPDSCQRFRQLLSQWF